MKARKVSGWGRFPRSTSQVCPLPSLETFPKGRGIPRGLGRSYGDASFYTKGYTWETSIYNQILHWDSASGQLTAEAGLSLYELIRWGIPQGWFPAVVPGTQFITIGGGFASNIHGKNHHLAGSFADHVEGIELLLPTGETRWITPSDPLFWATAGGMGLTGIITRVKMRLTRIETAYILNRVRRAGDWETLVRTLAEEEMQFPFAVAWVDHTDDRGRGIVHLGQFATLEDLPPSLRKRPLRTYGAGRLKVPFEMPFPLFGRLTVPLISAWYHLRHKEGTFLLPYAPYFFPLDGVQYWNRLWGRSGFIQFQFVVPTEAGLHRIWDRLRRAPARSFLTVLKRLGPQKGPLAFSGPGWTLAIDLPATEEVRVFLVHLADQVIIEGGRLYLTKDSLLHPEQFRAAYPGWSEFLALKAHADPEGRLRSNLSERLGLTP